MKAIFSILFDSEKLEKRRNMWQITTKVPPNHKKHRVVRRMTSIDSGYVTSNTDGMDVDMDIDMDVDIVDDVDTLEYDSADLLCMETEKLCEKFGFDIFDVVDADRFREAVRQLDYRHRDAYVERERKRDIRMAAERKSVKSTDRQIENRSKHTRRRSMSVGASNNNIPVVAIPTQTKPKPAAVKQSAITKEERMSIMEEFIVAKYPANRIFADVEKRGPVCRLCLDEVKDQPGEFCFLCADDDNNNTVNAANRSCRICHKKCGKLVKCSHKGCGKKFHLGTCLSKWPQHVLMSDKFVCPYHFCHTCESKSSIVVTENSLVANNQLIKCMECPASYHRSIACIPAATQIISDEVMICPRHYVKPIKPANVNFCFECGEQGGHFVCCDTCPGIYHKTCLRDTDIDDASFSCPLCVSGKMPLYGDMVWAKMGSCKWWPAIIVAPWLVPEKLRGLKKSNCFCVCFFDRIISYAWLSKERVYPMTQHDDSTFNDVRLNAAHQDAQEFFKTIMATPPHTEFTAGKRKFRRLSRNVWMSNKPQAEDELCGQCDCRPDQDSPCGPSNGCINYLMKVECGKNCKAGGKCQNQRFEKAIYPKTKIKMTDGRGRGLFAKEPIAEHQFVMEYVGEIIDEHEYKRRSIALRSKNHQEFYFLSSQSGYYIDATHRGNDARYINHSCDPNLELQRWNVNGRWRVGFFALKSIPKVRFINFFYSI